MDIVVLNGIRKAEQAFWSVYDTSMNEIGRLGWKSHAFCLDEIEIHECAGCFHCWIKTPGECVIADPARDIARQVMQSDAVLCITPVVFGGYSYTYKKALDRMIPIGSPFFTSFHGETHHQLRYEKYPDWITIGIMPEPDEETSRVFTNLLIRNALNMHSTTSNGTIIYLNKPQESIKQEIGTILQNWGAKKQ